MSETVKMPALGESVTEGTVTRWLKAVGDTVAVDEPLLEVSTDKVDTEIPSPIAGVLQKILAEEDDTVEVGADLAVIGADAEAASDEGAPEAPAAEGQAEAAPEAGAEAPAEEAPQQAAEEQPPAPEPAPEPEQAAPAEESAPAPAAQAEQPAAAASAEAGTDVTLPALGESVTEGTITRWLKAVGDEIAVDEPLLEVSTDKVDTEIPSPVAGTVLEILAAEDETVEVGAVLARVGAAAPEAKAPEPEPQAAPEPEPAAAEPEEAKAEPSAAEPEQAAAPEPEPAPAAPAPAPAAAAPAATTPEPAPRPSAAEALSGTSTTYVTPLVRKLAGQHGVDLEGLTGTGVGGRIRKQDVLDAAEAAKAAAAAPAAAAPAAPAGPAATVLPVSPLRGTREKMSRLRKIVAQRMVESLQVSAQLTTVVEVDVTRIARLRDRAKADFATREGAKLTYLPFFALATTEALKAYPKLNASIEGEEIVYHGAENVGIAVDTDRGLVVPVVKDAGDLNIAGFARKIADLASRTRANKAVPDELSGGTFTLTNTGSGGALFDTPILLQPQVGILGIGTIVKRPMVVKDADGAEVIAVRSMVYLALSYDHRLVDGADAGRFLTAIKNRLEEGAFESDLGL